MEGEIDVKICMSNTETKSNTLYTPKYSYVRYANECVSVMYTRTHTYVYVNKYLLSESVKFFFFLILVGVLFKVTYNLRKTEE